MSDTKRVTFTYDTEYDKEIEQILSAVPERRRSERIRQLLILGIRAENRNLDDAPIPKKQKEQTEIVHDTQQHPKQVDEAGLENNAVHETEDSVQLPVAERRRPIIRFRPPNSNT